GAVTGVIVFTVINCGLTYLGVNPSEALERYQEAFEIIRQGLATGRLDYQGKHWSYADVNLSIRPVQSPPPIWYAAGGPDSAAWPARNFFNMVCAGPVERVREVVLRYRSEQASVLDGRASANLFGVNRYIVVAKTDALAREIADRAWQVHHKSFWTLWHRYDSEPRGWKLPPTLDPLIESGFVVIGSPTTVRAEIERQVEISGVNYLSGNFAFGDLSFDEVVDSVSLFAEAVIPALSKR
ncbi:MAG: LLM class flavin-dependent oxidoreductase, partial [Bradyrhizobium sp.]|nr:LLM class flavin-dependent oxidoreductase [Bradyrhizobium sp.]